MGINNIRRSKTNRYNKVDSIFYLEDNEIVNKNYRKSVTDKIYFNSNIFIQKT